MYSRAMKTIPRNAVLEMAPPREAPLPDSRTIAGWVANGAACVRIRVVRRWRRTPKHFGVLVDGVHTIISHPYGHPLLLTAGLHTVASATPSPLGRYFAVLTLASAEDVTLEFRASWLDTQTGPGWKRLTQTDNLVVPSRDQRVDDSSEE